MSISGWFVLFPEDGVTVSLVYHLDMHVGSNSFNRHLIISRSLAGQGT